MASSVSLTKNPLTAGGGKGFTFSLETPSLSSGTLDKYLKQVLGEGSSSALPDLLKTTNADGSTSAPSISQSSSADAPKTETPATAPAESKPTPVTVTAPPVVTSAPVQQPPIPAVTVDSTPQAVSAAPVSHISNQQLATTDSLVTGQGSEMIPIPRGQSYVDITDYLNMPQADAAKKLGIPPSTLSKRWKEAVRKRKWPYRMICKIDKEIMTLLHNVPQGPNAPPLPEEIETALGLLLRKRQEELRPVVIRI